ncbi:MAG: excinuclease ABC subunit UvrA [Bacteroidales bacterium]|nr:excinuclease ABC subunit UvrA [Bacteroidales bacterium]
MIIGKLENSANISAAESLDLENIHVYGARVHNLKNIDVTIPRNKLTVITGLSGSGKSSLAFDTIFAEGQRRYIETFSAYARQFLGSMERPDVDKITGLSPVISIEQKSTNKNPRSTVGTITEIYDFLRLWYARAGEAYSYISGKKMVKYTIDQIYNLITEHYGGQRVIVLAPVVKGRKGHYRELFEQIRRKGYVQVRVDGVIKDIIVNMKTVRYQTHNIEIVVDKILVPTEGTEGGGMERLKKSVQTAMDLGKGMIMLLNPDTGEVKYYSKSLMCPESGISYPDPAPNNFSYNSPSGCCQHCKGLGYVQIIDIKKVIPNPELSIKQGAIEPLGKYVANSFVFKQLEAIAERDGFSLDTPVKDLPQEALDTVLNGSAEPVKLSWLSMYGSDSYLYDGIIKYIANAADDEDTQDKVLKYSAPAVCPECGGMRLNREALSYRIAGKNIAELSSMDIAELSQFLQNVDSQLTPKQKEISTEILKEIRNRVGFMLDVGLDYLSLFRPAQTLSGGEAQRIRLATQIGSKLVNVLYILDEPSIGLHQRDNDKLIKSLQTLRDEGNSIIVVEHDKDMIKNADYVIDIGPGAGRLGGFVTAECTPAQLSGKDTITAKYISGELDIDVPEKHRKGSGKYIELLGCTGNNLKNVDLRIPLGKLVLITGVSGSGKSTLINETLRPILTKHFYRSLQEPLPYKEIRGIENIDKVIEVNQDPIGRTPRSNPCTYTNIFADIRQLYAELPQSKIMGYKPGRFSFNVKGGRCEDCQGAGVKTVEMNFLPDVYVKCDACNGRRYNRETLEVKFKGKSISDMLDMTINRACEFFENVPKILKKLRALQDVGMGYVTLGQAATTLSGGEAQRIKLAAELSKNDTGKTLYILDEPTTGLHLEDIRILMNVLNKLVDKGNTVVIIEHNLDVIKTADYIIDLGPEGGRRGGEIIAQGTPEEIVKQGVGFTSQYLAPELKAAAEYRKRQLSKQK